MIFAWFTVTLLPPPTDLQSLPADRLEGDLVLQVTIVQTALDKVIQEHLHAHLRAENVVGKDVEAELFKGCVRWHKEGQIGAGDERSDLGRV